MHSHTLGSFDSHCSTLSWPVRTLSFSYDSSMIASASEDLFIDIVSHQQIAYLISWLYFPLQAYIQTGEKVHQISTQAPTFTVAWHPKRHLLAYACDDKVSLFLNLLRVTVTLFSCSSGQVWERQWRGVALWFTNQLTSNVTIDTLIINTTLQIECLTASKNLRVYAHFASGIHSSVETCAGYSVMAARRTLIAVFLLASSHSLLWSANGEILFGE